MPTRRLASENLAELVEEIGRHPFPDAHGAVALHNWNALGNRLDSALAIFVQRAILIRIGPRAPGIVHSVKLIQARKGAEGWNQPRLVQRELDRLENSLQASGDAGRICDLNGVGLDRRLGVRESPGLRVNSDLSDDTNALSSSSAPDFPRGLFYDKDSLKHPLPTFTVERQLYLKEGFRVFC
jgi:hypothetical protein